MIPRDRVINAILGKEVDRTPAASVTQTATVEQMESVKSYWPEAHLNPEKMANLSMVFYKETGLESARVPFDLTVLAESFGCTIDMGKVNIQPSVRKDGHISADEIERLDVPEELLQGGRIQTVLKAVEILKDTVGDNLPIIAGYEGPVTLAGHLLGMEKFMMWFKKKPENIGPLLNVTAKACREYGNALYEAGADVVVPCDPTASPEALSPKDFKKHLKPALSDLAENLEGTKVLHICGNITRILNDLKEIPFDALSIEEKVDLSVAKKILGEDLRIVGNISPIDTLLRGTPKDVREESIKALKCGVDLLAPGCGVAPETPTRNLRAMADAAR